MSDRNKYEKLNIKQKAKAQRIFRPIKVTSKNVFFFLFCSIAILVYSTKNDAVSLFIFEKIDHLICLVQRPFSSASMQVKKTSQIIKEKTELINEIDSLNKRINNYQKALFNYKELKAENDYLKSILPIAESINMKTFTVIKRTASCQPFVVISSDENFENVRPGDVVISTDGLFGRVVSKNNKKITVLLATHIHSRIPVISRESKNRAILFGQNCDFLKIKYVTNDNASGEVQECEAKKNFIEGEILETIDTGGFFPQSIPVAKIEKDKTGHIKAKWLCSEGKELFMTILFKK